MEASVKKRIFGEGRVGPELDTRKYVETRAHFIIFRWVSFRVRDTNCDRVEVASKANTIIQKALKYSRTPTAEWIEDYVAGF